ncbi:c-type cytochrome [Inquilinus sp. CAU 1745]|uniref:c-type cytochrome n=1 Tax=Inquilinus sp. CAU 1745 TaxID=3140369 RepID=UPI00325BB380
MRLTPLRALIAIVALGVGGFLFAWSGLFNIAASTGHWPITDWFLHFTMRSSVRTHALGIETPPLDDPALVQRGAGHYATGCAPCHGGATSHDSPVAESMTPPPPFLVQRIDEWEPHQLFWIVKHGVKYTGMPSWPAHGRDDEVWAVVAFLKALPDLEAEEYRRLAWGVEDASAGGGLDDLQAGPRDALQGCARCHGLDGAGGAPGAFPLIAGQTERYLLNTLHAFADGTRNSGIMESAVAGLSDESLRALAGHYAAAPLSEAPSSSPAADPESVARGQEIATEGIPSEGVPACLSCHAGDPAERHPAYPNLFGQDAGYLARQLTLWQEDSRGGGPYAHIMETIAKRLSPEDIEDAAAYFSTTAPP